LRKKTKESGEGRRKGEGPREKKKKERGKRGREKRVDHFAVG